MSGHHHHHHQRPGPRRYQASHEVHVPAAGANRDGVQQNKYNESLIRKALAQHDDGNLSYGEPCAICAEPIKFRALYPCGHSEICGECAVRVRVLAKNRLCIFCKQDCEFVVVTANSECCSDALDDARGASADNDDDDASSDKSSVVVKHYDDYGIYGSIGGPNLSLDRNSGSGVFFHTTATALKDELFRLRTFRCGTSVGPGSKAGAKHSGKSLGPAIAVCEETFSSLDELNSHLAASHGLFICELCASHRAVFVQELPRFTAAQLAAHCEKGSTQHSGANAGANVPEDDENAAGFKGHPLCRFCDSRFFSDSELFTHLQVEHFLCHLCSRVDPSRRQYYNSYQDLEQHFVEKHHLCQEASCKAKHFVVFPSLLELQAHAAAEHGASIDLTSQLSFRYVGSASSAGAATSGAAGRRGGRSEKGREEKKGTSSSSSSSAAAERDVSLVTGGGRLSHLEFSSSDFPSLLEGSAPSEIAASVQGGASTTSESAPAVAFPALGTSTAGPVPFAGAGQHSSHFHRAVVSGVSSASHPKALNLAADFPTLSAGGSGVGAGAGLAATVRRGKPTFSSSVASSSPFSSSYPFGRSGLSAYASIDRLLAMTGQAHLLGGPASSHRRHHHHPYRGQTTADSKPVPGQVYLTTTEEAKAEATREEAAQFLMARGKKQHKSKEDVLEASKATPSTPESLPEAAKAETSLPIGAAAPSVPPVVRISRVLSAAAESGLKIPTVGGVEGPVGSSLPPFDLFRSLSTSFRGGLLQADDYHSRVVSVFKQVSDATRGNLAGVGEDAMQVFVEAFPSLIEKLPDEDKKQALLACHTAWLADFQEEQALQRLLSPSSKALTLKSDVPTLAAPPHSGAPSKENFPSLPTSSVGNASSGIFSGKRYASTAAAAPPKSRASAAPVAPPAVPVHVTSASGSLLPSKTEEAFPSMPVRKQTAPIPQSKPYSAPASRSTMASNPSFDAPVTQEEGDEDIVAPSFSVDLFSALSSSMLGFAHANVAGQGKRKPKPREEANSEAAVFRVSLPRQEERRKAESATATRAEDSERKPFAKAAEVDEEEVARAAALEKELQKQREREARKKERLKRKGKGGEDEDQGDNDFVPEAIPVVLPAAGMSAVGPSLAAVAAPLRDIERPMPPLASYPKLGTHTDSATVQRSVIGASIDSLLANAEMRKEMMRQGKKIMAPVKRGNDDLDRLVAKATSQPAKENPAAAKSVKLDDDLLALMGGVGKKGKKK